MLSYEQINFLAGKAHSCAMRHGFYDDVEDNPAKLEQLEVLLAGEIGEIVDADRKGKWYIQTSMFAESELNSILEGDTVTDFQLYYDQYIKGTVEEELADVCIRCFDILGFMKETVVPFSEEAMARKRDSHIYDNTWKFAHKLYELCLYLRNNPLRVVIMIELVDDFSRRYGVNLDLHIQAKMMFNELRPYKHDRKY